MTEAGVLQRAVAAQRWEAAALCLLVAVAEAANRLPPQALEQMLELLAAETTTQRQRRTSR
ncbi:MAG TPA: hypothetical protein VIW01_11650 [Dehalococcoidia bacterium]